MDGEKTVATGKDFQFPAWSPDGKSITCVTNEATRLTEVKIEGGEEKAVGSKEWFDIQQIAWETDGRGLFISTAEKGLARHQIWRLSYPEGEARRITNDSNDYWGLALAADSSGLVTGQLDQISAISIVPIADTSRAVSITTGKFSISPCWTPDNRVLFSSETPEGFQIWIMDADGGNQRQLTSDSGFSTPHSVSPDGRFIFYCFMPLGTGHQNVWRMDIDGGNAKQLTYAKGMEVGAEVTPDGQWVLYTDTGIVDTKPTIWKVPINGGTPVQVTQKFSTQPSISPDGSLMACSYRNEPTSDAKVSIIPIDGQGAIKTYDIPFKPFMTVFEWAADGRSLLYIDSKGGFSNIWSQPLDGGAPKKLTDFKTDHIFGFDLSSDGKLLAIARGRMTSDVVLISHLK